MNVFYYSTKEKRAPGYGCVAGYVDGGKTCQMMSSAPVDAAVAELFLAAVTPAQVDVALRALDEYTIVERILPCRKNYTWCVCRPTSTHVVGRTIPRSWRGTPAGW
jgi:hypothetical protein